MRVMSRPSFFPRTVHSAVSIIFAVALFGSASAAMADDVAVVQGLMPEIEAQLDPEFLSAANQHLSEQPGKGVEPVMGMVMMLQGKAVPAAWFYAHDVLSHPDGVAARNNLGVALQAAAGTGESPSTDAKWVDAGATLLGSAREADPDNAIVNANYGQALLQQWRQGQDTDGQQRSSPVNLDDALAALRHAIAIDPDNPYAYAHLAEVLLAMGDVAGAQEAFNEAQSRWSTHPAIIAAGQNSPGITGAGNSSPMPQCDGIDVVALCNETCKCDSIIGCLNFVTCTMSNSDFVGACRAGEPIPTGYNCEAEFPEYGIQLPGLQSGFSIIGPGFTVQVGPDGKGGYKWEVKAGPNAYVKVGGSIDPHTGAVSGVDVTGGVTVTAVPGGGKLGNLLGKYGLQPGSVTVEPTADKPIKVGAWEDASGLFIQD